MFPMRFQVSYNKFKVISLQSTKLEGFTDRVDTRDLHSPPLKLRNLLQQPANICLYMVNNKSYSIVNWYYLYALYLLFWRDLFHHHGLVSYCFLVFDSCIGKIGRKHSEHHSHVADGLQCLQVLFLQCESWGQTYLCLRQICIQDKT